MRNYQAKLGDFGVSIVTKQGQQSYQFNGVTPSYLSPCIRKLYPSNPSDSLQMKAFLLTKFSIETLKQNDYYALYKTFRT